MRFDEVAKCLQLDSTHERWRTAFDRSAESFSPDRLAVIDPDEWERRFAFFNMSPEPARVLRLARAQVAQSRALQRVLWHMYHRYFVDDFMFDLSTDIDEPVHAPSLPPHTGEGGALIYALMCVEALPVTLKLYDQRGIPHDIAKATLRDLERWIRECHTFTGRWGMVEDYWLSKDLRAHVLELGRLQFEPGTVTPEYCTDIDATPLRQGEDVLIVHIPASGAMSHDACEQSFHQALTFFPRYFPERNFRAFITASWLLDRQLADYLPRESNIVRFLERFEQLTWKNAADTQTFDRVFGGPIADIDSAPQDTALRRAIVQHVKAGKKWKMSAGYIMIDATK